MNTQKQIVLIVVLLFIFMGGCTAYSLIDLTERAPDQVVWSQNESIERGALLYANNCRTCHGIKGEGFVGPALNTPDFKDQDPLILKANQALIKTTLYCGRAGTRMPPWLNTNGGSLNAIQIQHLIDLITAPVDTTDEEGDDTSQGWIEAVEFGYNLNHETAATVGGDTLDTIAKQHGIGPAELAKANNLPIQGLVKKGSVLKIPGFKADPNGYDYHVYRDNETITKIAESQHVGALILADLNNIAYSFSEKKGVATYTLQDETGATVTGLFPGITKLQMPEGAAYAVAAGDTVEAIATAHGLTTSAVVSGNQAILGGLSTDDSIPSERRLRLPKATVVAQAGDTVGVIATAHATSDGVVLKPADLASLNGIDIAAALAEGQALKLPDGAIYTIQIGDTWESIAQAHATTAADIAAANNAKTSDVVSPEVILTLPKVAQYTVQGQLLEDVAGGYGNVTAERLAEVNGVSDPKSVLAIGTSLKLPPETFGNTPPDTINLGTACVQNALPASVYNTLPGISTATVVPITKPTTVSATVKVEAHADDWTVTADGVAQAANKGVVLVAKGIAISFTSVAGLHTVTVNGKTSTPDLKQGDTQTVTFNDAGQFTITCIYHPNMLANIYVE